MKKLILYFIVVCSVWACSDSSSSGPDPDPPVEPFTEGQIDVEVSMPGHPALEVFVDVFGQIDPEAGEMEEQLEIIIQNLSEEDRGALQEFEEAFESGEGPEGLAPFFAIIYLPILEHVIYIREDEATAKFDALTYHGENRYNLSSESGQYYINSRWYPENRISYTYIAEDLFDDFAQTAIDDEFYDIEQTGVTETIAGYTAAKRIYTVKNTDNPAGPYRLEVWTSEEMTKSVNFSHPFYLEEEGGIMKIAAFLTPDESFPIVYEFVNVTSRSVSDAEMAIQQSEPFYDYGEDADTVGLKMFDILFGSSGEESE